MIMKICRWCKKEFETDIPNKLYCSDEHRKEARLESKRKSNHIYYQNNKKDHALRQIGTTTISTTPNPDFNREQTIITNEKKRTYTLTNGKGSKNNNTWIDFGGCAEYGDPAPIGIQNTHKGASFDDYVYTSRYYAMSNRGPCPECSSTDAIKDVKHCLISCKACGLILEVTPSMVAPVSGEAKLCTTIIEKGKGNRKDKKTIDTKMLKNLSFKAYWIQFKGDAII